MSDIATGSGIAGPTFQQGEQSPAKPDDHARLSAAQFDIEVK
jgi:hypothetical protein